MQLNKRQILENNVVASSQDKKSEIRSPAYKKLKATNAEEEESDVSPQLPETIVKEVLAMKKKDMQAALRARHLDVYGLKQALQDRLLEALTKEHFSCAAEEKQDPLCDADDEEQVHPGIRDATHEENTSNISSPKSERHSVVMIDQMEETESMNISEDDVKRISLDEVADEKKEVAEKPTASEASETSNAHASTGDCDDIKSQDADENLQKLSESTKHPSVKMDGKRPRSPMKRVQEGVNSAMKLLSNKKSPRSIPSPSKPTAAAGTGPVLKTMNGLEYKAHFGSLESKNASHSDKPIFQLKGASENGSLSSGSSSIKSGNSALKSKHAQATTNARMAKLQEIRGKVRDLCTRKCLRDDVFSALSLSS
jgi:hypothetical protein